MQLHKSFTTLSSAREMTDMPTNNKRSRVEYSDGRHVQEEEYGSEQRARKACSQSSFLTSGSNDVLLVLSRHVTVNCRRQKMKCLVEDDSNECRRCRRSGMPCIFVPRANAATLPEFKNGSREGGFKTDVLRRLQIIEDTLGLSEGSNGNLESIDGGNDEGFDDEEETSDEFNSLSALWDAVVVLQSAPCSVPRAIWRRHTIRDLWLSWVSTKSFTSEELKLIVTTGFMIECQAFILCPAGKHSLRHSLSF